MRYSKIRDNLSSKFFNPKTQIIWIVVISGVILFLCSSLKHALFQSTAWDLGIFDQAMYLLSRGQPPISSFTNFHILGDHAALILYPLSLLYRIYPDVHWLLATQAIALAVAALPVYKLSLNAGLKNDQSLTLAGVYLLYPMVFNLNLFDFHPEVYALPAFFWAILSARTQKIYQFGVSLALILSCKAVLALTVATMGIWLIAFEKRRIYGIVAILSGIIWFIIATQVIIPMIGGEGATIARHINRYSYLGNSFSEIVVNLVTKPQIALGRIFSLGTLEYLALMLFPLIWRLSPQHVSALVPAIPAFVMNVLSADGSQRDLLHQYSLPILPFLMLVVIANLAARTGWLRSDRQIILWALLGFLMLSRLHFFAGRYWESFDTWQPTREAIAQFLTTSSPRSSILTTAEIAPHLTHRPIVKLAVTEPAPSNLSEFNYVLLNLGHPGWQSNREFASKLVEQLQGSQRFQLTYQNHEVYLFRSSNMRTDGL